MFLIIPRNLISSKIQIISNYTLCPKSNGYFPLNTAWLQSFCPTWTGKAREECEVPEPLVVHFKGRGWGLIKPQRVENFSDTKNMVSCILYLIQSHST